MRLKILIDDARSIWDPRLPRHDYDIQFTNAKSFIFLLDCCGGKLDIDFISFDHDLGVGLNGYDCAKYLVEWLNTHNKDIPDYHVHSMNVVGAERIRNIIEDARKYNAASRTS